MNDASTSRKKMVQMDQGKSMKQTHVKGMLGRVRERRKLHFPRSPVGHVCTVVSGENYISHALAFHIHISVHSSFIKTLASSVQWLNLNIQIKIRNDAFHGCFVNGFNSTSTSKMKIQMDQG